MKRRLNKEQYNNLPEEEKKKFEIYYIDPIFNPGYGEDSDFCAKLEDAGYKIKQVPEDSNIYYGDKRMAGNFPIYHEGNVTFKNYPGGEELLARNNKILEDRYATGLKLDKAMACDGWMNNEELKWLATKANKHGTILEMGSWHGRSTRALGDNAKGIVYAIDTWNGSVAEPQNHGSALMENGDHAFMEFCDNNIDLIESGKIVPIRMNSESAAKMLKKNGVKFSMIFIDGGHTYEEVKKDIEMWKDLLTDDGLFCGHDYNAWIGVNQAVDELITNPKIDWGTTIWYCGKEDIKPDKPAIYDCFPFNSELDILERRLNELYDTVDRFVIVEATKTHGNESKPLYFQNNIKRFEKYLNKISHVVIDDYPALDSWSIERHQRDCIMRALTQCKDNDVILISDADEIPTPEAIKSFDGGIKSFSMNLYYYNENTKAADLWTEAKILTYGLLKEKTPCGARYTQAEIIPNAGKHLSYFGDIEAIIRKIENTAHQEYNKPEFKTREWVESRIKESKDIFGRDLKFEKI